MQDIIANIAAQQLAEIIIALALGVVSAAGTFALAQLTRLLGQKRIATLREMLTPAIDRALAQAREQGLDEERARQWATDYLKQTMGGTLSKLKASDDDLAKRVAAQAATSLADAIGR